MTEDGRKFLEEFCCKDKLTELTLSQDRTFRLVNIPDCWLVETRAYFFFALQGFDAVEPNHQGFMSK